MYQAISKRKPNSFFLHLLAIVLITVIRDGFLRFLSARKKGVNLVISSTLYMDVSALCASISWLCQRGEWTISVRNNDTSREIIVHLTLYYTKAL